MPLIPFEKRVHDCLVERHQEPVFAADMTRDVVIILREHLQQILKNFDAAKCKSCQAPIWFVPTRTGHVTPFDADGNNHFVTCPTREQHKKGGAR